MMAPLLLSLCALLAVPFVHAVLPDGRPHGNMRPFPVYPSARSIGATVVGTDGKTLPPYNTTYYFQQLIDHNNPGLGTFKQRYWHTWEYYKPGGPIILATPGEVNAESISTQLLTNQTMSGVIAREQHGATIVIEHRFFGLSNPRPDLSAKSLQLLTAQQAISDLVYFAKNVKLAMPGGSNVPPDKVPWILIGGSYAGMLASWTMLMSDTFAVGYASSAPIQDTFDFWRIAEPIRENMAKNCSADVEAVIAHIDATLMYGTPSAVSALKNSFGMGDVTYGDDFGGALRSTLWEWQNLQPAFPLTPYFQDWCDALEVKNGKHAPASGWGVDYALPAWAAYWKNVYMPYTCGDLDGNDCFGTHDSTQDFYTDTSIDNAYRSWEWLLCNQFAFWEDGAPWGHPTLISRLVQPQYDQRQCQYFFPGAFPLAYATDVSKTNSGYGGWNIHTDNLFLSTATRDPWREATVSGSLSTFKSTASNPVKESDGFHTSDLYSANTVDASVAAVQTAAISFVKQRLATWKAKRDVSERSVQSLSAFAGLGSVHGRL